MKNVKCTYGNIYKLDTILQFKKDVGNKAHFITADGGFGMNQVENGYHIQEQVCLQLFYCEITTALTIQAKGGTFVLKIYDCFSKITSQLILLLTQYYKNVFIYKPFTSRSFNSEKYIICTEFKGITINELNNFQYLVSELEDNINIIKNSELQFTFVKNMNMFRNDKENYKKKNNYIIEALTQYNIIYCKKQIKNIELAIELNNRDDKNINLELRNLQISCFQKWIKKFNFN